MAQEGRESGRKAPKQSTASIPRTMEIEDLSDELLIEILWRLPVKSLLQLKSVCKNWYDLLRSPYFINLHHDRAASIAADENTDCLLVKRFLSGDEGGFTLSFVPNETPVEDIDISSTGVDMKHLRLLGSCNGVICLTVSGFNSSVVLWNPSMKEFRVLPEPSYKNDHMSNFGFGYDPYRDDYKVVRFGMMSSDLPLKDIDKAVEMYDLSTDSWRVVDTESPVESGIHCFYDSYVSWNGDFFWYAYHQHGGGAVIMAFSMSDEEFEEIPVPEVWSSDQISEHKLFVLNDSLAMVIYPQWWSNQFMLPPEENQEIMEEFVLSKSFDIWVMDDDDVVSWTRTFTIGPFRGLGWALGFRLNGEFLVESCYGQMMSYNLYTRERKEYQVHDQVRGHPQPPNLQVLLYIESLVSVKR